MCRCVRVCMTVHLCVTVHLRVCVRAVTESRRQETRSDPGRVALGPFWPCSLALLLGLAPWPCSLALPAQNRTQSTKRFDRGRKLYNSLDYEQTESKVAGHTRMHRVTVTWLQVCVPVRLLVGILFRGWWCCYTC